jgi:hypothetical protein
MASIYTAPLVTIASGPNSELVVLPTDLVRTIVLRDITAYNWDAAEQAFHLYWRSPGGPGVTVVESKLATGSGIHLDVRSCMPDTHELVASCQAAYWTLLITGYVFDGKARFREVQQLPAASAGGI